MNLLFLNHHYPPTFARRVRVETNGYERAMDSVPFRTDEIPTNISGAEVPRATIVNPIVNSLKPSFFAIKDELSINLSAPQIKTDNEMINPIR